MIFFSHLPLKITLHPSHFKEKFPPKIFRWHFVVIIYQTKISLPNFYGKFSGLWDFYTFLLFLSKRSWKVPVRHDLLHHLYIYIYIYISFICLNTDICLKSFVWLSHCIQAILTYKICIPHFHLPVRRTGAYRHKNSPANNIYEWNHRNYSVPLDRTENVILKKVQTRSQTQNHCFQVFCLNTD